MVAVTLTGVAWLIAMGLSRGLGRRGGTLVSQDRIGELVAIIVGGGGLAIGLGVAAFALVRRRQRRMQTLRDAEAATLMDDVLQKLGAGQPVRPFFVYLRSFSTTGRLLVKNPEGSVWAPGRTAEGPLLDLEVALGRALEPLGPLVALGEPGEQIGAGRIPSDEGSWRRTVTLLVDHAAGILVVPSDGKGTIWEIGRLRTRKLLARTIFVMPPAPPAHVNPDFDLAEVWRRATMAVRAHRIELPPYDPAGLLFIVKTDGRVRTSQGVRFHQERKVRAAMETLLGAAAARAAP